MRETSQAKQKAQRIVAAPLVSFAEQSALELPTLADEGLDELVGVGTVEKLL